MKKLLLLFLFATSAILCNKVYAQSTHTATTTLKIEAKSSDWNYSIQNDTEIFLTYKGKETELTVPSEFTVEDYSGIQKYTVVGVDAGNAQVVHLPGTIKGPIEGWEDEPYPSTILSGYSIKEIKLDANANLTVIDNVVYTADKTTLVFVAPLRENSTLDVPEGVKYIYPRAADGCSTLRTLTLPSTLKKIFGSGFYNCGITEVKLNDGLEEIGENAFNDCRLTEITIPSSVKKIGAEAFRECRLEKIALNEGLQYIGYDAFEGNRVSNGEITIPSTVTHIGDGAFSMGWGYKYNHIIIKGSNLRTLGERAIPANKVTFPSLEAFMSIDYISELYPGETCHSPLYYCNKVQFGDQIWEGIIKLPAGITEIKAGTFYQVENLKEFTADGTIYRIGEYAFCGTGLESLYIKGLDIFIGPDAFANNTKLSSVTIVNQKPAARSYDDPTEEDEATFSWFVNCPQLSSVTLEGFSSLPSQIFDGCKSLKQFNIDKSVTNISYETFDGSYLSQITVDEANPAYSTDGTSLMSKDGKRLVVVVPGISVDYTIPTSVTTIGEYAFDCTPMSSVTIPAHVTQIDQYAFGENILYAYFVNTTPVEGYYNWNLTVYVPTGCKSAYEEAGWDTVEEYPVGAYLNFKQFEYTVAKGKTLNLANEISTNLAGPFTYTAERGSYFFEISENGILSVTEVPSMDVEGEIEVTAANGMKSRCKITISSEDLAVDDITSDAEPSHFEVIDRRLVIDAQGTTVQVFSINGANLLTTTGYREMQLNPGVYIIRDGKNASKVLIK